MFEGDYRRQVELMSVVLAFALVLEWAVTCALDSQVVDIMMGQYVLYPEAYPWWRLNAVYFVVNWATSLVLVPPTFISAVGLIARAGWARTVLVACAGIGLVTNIVASTSHLLLWTADGATGARISWRLGVGAVLAAATIVVEATLLHFLRKAGSAGVTG